METLRRRCSVPTVTRKVITRYKLTDRRTHINSHSEGRWYPGNLGTWDPGKIGQEDIDMLPVVYVADTHFCN